MPPTCDSLPTSYKQLFTKYIFRNLHFNRNRILLNTFTHANIAVVASMLLWVAHNLACTIIFMVQLIAALLTKGTVKQETNLIYNAKKIYNSELKNFSFVNSIGVAENMRTK